MNCRDFELLVTDLARGGLLLEPEARTALAHVEDCARCAERLEREWRLSAAFLGLAEAETAGAPPRLEMALRAAFSERRRAVRWPRWAVPAAGLAAAAAVLVAVTWTSRTPQLPQPPIEKRAAVIPSPLAETAAPPKPAAVVSKKLRRAAKPVPARAAAVHEALTPFVALDTAAPVTGSSQVVRIRMPRAALRTFGFPINEERAAERINADVLLGEDGTALAIRLVR